MAGSTAGGKKCAVTNKQKYGENYYALIGAKGGKNGKTGGFAHMAQHDPERHKQLSTVGGKLSKRIVLKEPSAV